MKNINEEDLKAMIVKGLSSAFQKNAGDLPNTGDATTDNFVSMGKMIKAVESELDEEKGYSSFLKTKDNPKGETEGLTVDVMNQILKRIVSDMGDENVEGETNEAMGAGSSGSYSAPLFRDPKKNNLFQPGTESKLTTKPEGGPVNEEKLKGGLADGKDIEDIAEMHDVDIDTVFEQLRNGVRVEMEHTTEMMVALEIAMDHLFEDPFYYDKLDKMEGGETTEVTSSSSSGAYDAPFGFPKRDPLKIDNSDTVEKNTRAVRDKKFPKYGGPGAKFVKVKSKCKKFPYCNQGDINALEFFEREMIKEAVGNTAKRLKVETYVIKNLIAKELGYITEQDEKNGFITFNIPNNTL
jgi:hypothetical protein